MKPVIPPRLLTALHTEERGSQTAEYAMIGGIGAAACGTLVALLKNQSLLGRLAEAVFDGLIRAVGGWF